MVTASDLHFISNLLQNDPTSNILDQIIQLLGIFPAVADDLRNDPTNKTGSIKLLDQNIRRYRTHHVRMYIKNKSDEIEKCILAQNLLLSDRAFLASNPAIIMGLEMKWRIPCTGNFNEMMKNFPRRSPSLVMRSSNISN